MASYFVAQAHLDEARSAHTRAVAAVTDLAQVETEARVAVEGAAVRRETAQAALQDAQDAVENATRTRHAAQQELREINVSS